MRGQLFIVSLCFGINILVSLKQYLDFEVIKDLAYDLDVQLSLPTINLCADIPSMLDTELFAARYPPLYDHLLAAIGSHNATQLHHQLVANTSASAELYDLLTREQFTLRQLTDVLADLRTLVTSINNIHRHDTVEGPQQNITCFRKYLYFEPEVCISIECIFVPRRLPSMDSTKAKIAEAIRKMPKKFQPLLTKLINYRHGMMRSMSMDHNRRFNGSSSRSGERFNESNGSNATLPVIFTDDISSISEGHAKLLDIDLYSRTEQIYHANGYDSVLVKEDLYSNGIDTALMILQLNKSLQRHVGQLNLKLSFGTQLSFIRSEAIFFNHTHHWFSFEYIHRILLPSPYETNCFRYTELGFRDGRQLFNRCVQYHHLDIFNRSMPFEMISVHADNLFGYNHYIRNEANRTYQRIHSDIIRTCRQLVQPPECDYYSYSSKKWINDAVFVDKPMSLLLYPAIDSSLRILSRPKYGFGGLANTILTVSNFWFGFSIYRDGWTVLTIIGWTLSRWLKKSKDWIDGSGKDDNVDGNADDSYGATRWRQRGKKRKRMRRVESSVAVVDGRVALPVSVYRRMDFLLDAASHRMHLRSAKKSTDYRISSKLPDLT